MLFALKKTTTKPWLRQWQPNARTNCRFSRRSQNSLMVCSSSSEVNCQGSTCQVGCAENVKMKEKHSEQEGFLSSRSFICWYWTHICGQRRQCNMTSECETHHTTVLWKHDPVVVNRDVLGWLRLGVNIVASANKDGLIPSSFTTTHLASLFLPLTNK